MMQLVCADMRQLADHLSRDHRVRAPNKTILNYMASLAREGVGTA
jgi:hypothetical protein